MNLWIFFEWLLILGNVGTAERETEHFQVHAGQLRDGTPIVVKVTRSGRRLSAFEFEAVQKSTHLADLEKC